jgi:multiple sugar transport system permease protein
VPQRLIHCVTLLRGVEARAVVQRVPRARRRDLLENRRFLAGALIAPAVLFIVLLVGTPLFLAIYLSFTDATSGSLSGHWVGLENFTEEWKNEIFKTALWNTALYTIASQILVVLGAGILAHALIRDFRGKWILRLLILLPWAAPVALTTIAFTWILDPTFSIVSWAMVKTHTLNAFCDITNIQNCSATSPPNWVGNTTLAKISIITVHSWRILPFATVIFLAGIASIPKEVHDAAAVDAATGLKKFWYVSLPLQLPIAIVAVLFGIVFTATDMAVTYLLTHGGPANSSHMLTTDAFQVGIESGRLGAGAAISLYLLPVLAVVAVCMLIAARRAEVA